MNTAFETGPVKPIAKSCLEMVVLNEDKMKVFSSSPLESWKELQEIIRDGLKTVKHLPSLRPVTSLRRYSSHLSKQVTR